MGIDATNAPKRLALDVNASNDLRQQLQKDSKAGLHKAAQEFESMFLQMVLKSMRDTVPQDGLFNSDQTRFYTSMLDQQMAQDLSSKGSMGFAKMLEEQFNRAAGTSVSSAAPNAANSSEPNPTGLSPAAQNLLQSLQQLKQSPNSSILPGNVPIPPSQSPQSVLSPQSSNAVQGIGSGSRGPGALTSENPADFVNKVWPHAVEVSRVTGIPPQFMVAQAALETGWGRHEMLNPDGAPSYNLFGIKAGKSWPGQSVLTETTEFVSGQETRVTASFKAYGSYAEAFQDYANLLRGNPRYGAVIGSQDGTEFARRLQQAGYATDPQYAEKLSRIINGPTLRQALIG
jgi:peptidoglycan hydrolase FlgJ